MSEPTDGKGGSPTEKDHEPTGAFITFSEHEGRVEMSTNIPDHLSRYGLWMAGLEIMFRANTMNALKAEAAQPQIVTPGMAERAALGILK